MITDRAIFLISGTQGAGKTTVARKLAERFDRGVHIEADLLQRLIVSGAEWPEPPRPTGEAARQLRMRARHAAMLADAFFSAGFTVVLDDIVLGDRLNDFRNYIVGRPLLLVSLAPSLDVVPKRNAERPGKNVFLPWSPLLDAEMRSTMRRIGLWIDSTNQTSEQTVDEILRDVWTDGVLRS
jgi:chloramphenicol 3-O-phosphotransferase